MNKEFSIHHDETNMQTSHQIKIGSYQNQLNRRQIDAAHTELKLKVTTKKEKNNHQSRGNPEKLQPKKKTQ